MIILTGIALAFEVIDDPYQDLDYDKVNVYYLGDQSYNCYCPENDY